MEALRGVPGFPPGIQSLQILGIAVKVSVVMLLAAGTNLALFRWAGWTRGEVAGVVSMGIWMGVVVAGRWTGHIN